jgi:hypothetical protein
MRRQSMAPHYNQLNPRERLQLVLAASAREDGDEIKRLMEACARKTYSMSDRTFVDAYDGIFRLNMAVLADLRVLLAEFRMSQTLLNVTTVFCLRAGLEIEEEMLFGHVAANGEARAKGAEVKIPGRSRDVTAPTADQLGDGQRFVDCFCRKRIPETVRAITQAQDDTARSIAAEVKGLLAGYDRFTQHVLGIDAVAALESIRPRLAAELAPVLAVAADADDATADQVEQAATAAWEKLKLR